MPQDLLRRPPGASGAPLEDGTDSTLDQAIRAFLVAVGAQEQAPGDLAGAVGGAASILPISRLLKFLKLKSPKNLGDSMLRNHEVVSPHLEKPNLPEFAPMTEGVRPPLDPEEALKEIELTSTPKRKTPRGK